MSGGPFILRVIRGGSVFALALCVLMASTGIGLIHESRISTAKPAGDSAWWPCKDHGCGCVSAEMCRTDCCCVKPVESKPSCCSARKDAAQCDDDAPAENDDGGGFRIVIRSTKCSGKGGMDVSGGIHWLPAPPRVVIASLREADAPPVSSLIIPRSQSILIDPPPPRFG